MLFRSKVRQFEEDLIHYMSQQHPEVKKEVVSKSKIDDALGNQLKEIIKTFKQKMGYGEK